MQAIIMAGGEGVRLRPMTLDRPKPIVPLLGEPVMGYALKLLKSHRVTDVTATLYYRPKDVRAAFGKGERYGVRMRYQEEAVQMGTAGGVLLAGAHVKGTFLVLSGDGLTDCDLSDALKFHKEKGALATLVVKRVPVPLAYGLVLTDEGGRIKRFIEKPGWRQAYSDLCNTGLYILERRLLDAIPEGVPYDFGKQLFPALLEKGEKLYAYETPGYWCDVGDQAAYLRAQRDLMAGKVRVALPDCVRISDGAWRDASARVHESAVLEDGCYIGENAIVGAGARLSRCCLWRGARVREKSELAGCVVCDRATVGVSARLSQDTALAAGASVGARAFLAPGVKVYPSLRVAPDAVAMETVIYGDYACPRFEEIASPQQACALVSALCRARPAKRVVLQRTEGAEALYHVVAGALLRMGADVILADLGTPGMLAALVRALRAGQGVFVHQDALDARDQRGLPYPRPALAAVEQAALRREGDQPSEQPGQTSAFTGAVEVYAASLPDAPAACAALPIAVVSQSSHIRALAREVLTRKGMKNARVTDDQALLPGETGFLLPSDGTRALAYASGVTPPEETQALLLARALANAGEQTLYAFDGLPSAAETLAPVQPPDGSEACARQTLMWSDGLSRMLLTLPLLMERPLDGLLAALPAAHMISRDVPCPASGKSRVLRALADTGGDVTLGSGVRIHDMRGTASILPDETRASVRVTAESANAEFACELCDFYSDRVAKAARGETE